MRRVLITGGAGFIGSHLVDHYVAEGWDVVVLDDLSTGDPRNLAHHSPDHLRLIESRVEDPAGLSEAFATQPDLVLHLAAAVGVFEVLEHQLHALRSNLAATDALFGCAAERGVRTIFTSTSEVYGKNNADGLRETDDSVFGPTSVARWLYGVSKATDEFMALAYHREHALPMTVVRLFNTTGPRQTGAYGMVLPRFIGQALSGRPITVYGSGHQTRCFTNVFDVVEALVRLADAPAAVGQVVNIGRPQEVSIDDLALLVKTLCESDSEIQHLDYADAYGPGFEDMRRRVPNVDKLMELTGYAPDTPLSVTIDQMIDWTRSQGVAPNFHADEAAIS